MNQEMMLVSLFMACLMAKKKNPVRKFGQMTLDLAGQALEYLKGDAKGVVRAARRVEWMNKHHATERGFVMPGWVLPQTDNDSAQFGDGQRYQDIAIVFDEDRSVLPLLVYQPSARRGLDEVLATAQEDGALVEDDGKMLVLDMGDRALGLRFLRNPKAGKFAPFIVRRD